MDLDTLLSYDWQAMMPEFIILGTAVLLSLIDLFVGEHKSRRRFGLLALAGVVAALAFLFTQLGDPVTNILAGTYRLDSFSKAFKLLLLVGTAFVLLMSVHYDKKEEKIKHRGEFYYLFLTALLGAMVLTSSADMITLFVGLELLSLSSYIMAGLNKKDTSSNEAAFKYIVNGGIATAVTLFGMSYIYGLTGHTNLYDISLALSSKSEYAALIFDNRLLVAFAFIMVFVGLSFKLATVPFQMWAPDVYQGAPTPVTAFLSVVSKTAGFVLILRFLVIIFMNTPGIEVSPQYGAEPMFLSVQPYLIAFAALAMIAGNTAALKQKNIKRLFAYSSIAQAGYVLVPFISLTSLTFDNVWFYLAAYLFMNLGAFAVIQVVTDHQGTEEVKAFSGLYKKSPWMALAMAVFLISLAGIPATAGFVGKFNIFVEAILAGQYLISSIMIATTVISYFYYFSIMAKMFSIPVSESQVKVPLGPGLVMLFGVIGTLMLGIFPETALQFLHHYFPFNDFFVPGS